MDDRHEETTAFMAKRMNRRGVLKRAGLGLAGAASLAAIGQSQASAGGKVVYCYVCCKYHCLPLCPPPVKHHPGKGKGKGRGKGRGRGPQGNNGFGNGGGDGVPGNSDFQDETR